LPGGLDTSNTPGMWRYGWRRRHRRARRCSGRASPAA